MATLRVKDNNGFRIQKITKHKIRWV